MRILVTSDTHGDWDNLRRAIMAQPSAQVAIHLGDGEEDMSRLRHSFPEKTFLQVGGNSDWGSSLPSQGEYDAEGVKIFYTHGHLYAVKTTDEKVISAGRDRGAKIVLYGHTHIPREDYVDGIYVMNPGRLGGWEPSYGVIDITEQGIVLNLIKLPV